ncbi:adhesion G protein-coupled receptor L4-like isoform X2 [Ptychodera flava]|uniref:adhesion G protein-coupled receptor L4-like isoform X2 n=1 Tax=Ptychodera flava TaxID=63121 RepID=UPI00396A32D1
MWDVFAGNMRSPGVSSLTILLAWFALGAASVFDSSTEVFCGRYIEVTTSSNHNATVSTANRSEENTVCTEDGEKCVAKWRIHASDAKTIRIRFHSLDIPGTSDWLDIYKARECPSEAQKEYRRFNNYSPPREELVIDNGFAWVRLRSYGEHKYNNQFSLTALSDVNDCASSPCENNGICIDIYRDYTCSCVGGMSGKNCEIDIAKMTASPSGTTHENATLTRKSTVLRNSTAIKQQEQQQTTDTVSTATQKEADVSTGNTAFITRGTTDKDDTAYPVRATINTVQRKSSDKCRTCGYYFPNQICEDPAGGYNCTCANGFEEMAGVCKPSPQGKAKICDEETVTKKCPLEVSDIGVAKWKETAAGCVTERKPCSGPSVAGTMTRKCGSDGQWLDPDVTQCVSEDFFEINAKAERANTLASANDVLDDLESIVESDDIITPGNLLASAELVRNLLNASPLTFNASEDSKKAFIHDVFKLLGSYFDEELFDVWHDIFQLQLEGNPVDGHIANIRRFTEDISQSAKKSLNDTTKNIAFAFQPFYVTSEMNVYGSNRKDDKARVKRRVQDDSAFESQPFDVTCRMNVSGNIEGNTLVKCRVQDGQDDVIIQFNAGKSSKKGTKIWITKTKLKTIGNILPPTIVVEQNLPQQTSTEEESANTQQVVFSEVIAVSLLPAEAISSRDISVLVKFNHGKAGSVSKTCVYLVDGHENGIWKTDGCFIQETNDDEGYTLCNCSRLAEFGLIMTFTARAAEVVQTREDFAVIILGIVIAIYTLSLALLLLARINNDHHFVLKNTLVSFLCLTASIFTAMNSQSDREGTVHCLLIAFCVNAFLLSACSWSLLAAVHLLLRIRTFIYKSSRARVSYLIIGWVSPVIYCLFSVAAIHTDYRDAKRCWVITGRVSLVIIIPAMVLYMATLSVMLLTYRKTSLYRCRVKMEEFGLTLFDLRSLAFMFALFTLSWIAGMWAITANSTAARAMFTLLILLQASFIVYYFVSRKEVADSLRLQLCCVYGCDCAATSEELAEINVRRKGVLKQAHIEVIKQKRWRKAAKDVNGASADEVESLTPSQREIEKQLRNSDRLQWEAYVKPQGTVWVVKHKTMSRNNFADSPESLV